MELLRTTIHLGHSRRILNNESLTGIKETVPVIVNGYKIWPIASIISFSFIPVERRIVFLSFIGLCWGVYMSLVAARV